MRAKTPNLILSAILNRLKIICQQRKFLKKFTFNEKLLSAGPLFMKTLKLFNAVPAQVGGKYKILPQYGIIVEPSASYAFDAIEKHYKEAQLTGAQLNATFHKSWEKVITSTREELLVEQIMHYLTTYGTNHQSEFIYTPNEELDVPDVTVNFLVVRGLDSGEIIEKALNILKSGVALTQDTLTDVLEVLDDSGYSFTGEEDVKNKEALMYLCQEANVLPNDPVELVRYLYFIATGETLLIKSKDTYNKIAQVKNNRQLNLVLKQASAEKLAQVFNRFKPIFLSLKKVVNASGQAKINKISRLSKTLHKPMSFNILNNIGSCTLADLKKQEENLKNANFFQLARCLNFLKQNAESTQNVYAIRNGKAFVKETSGNAPRAAKSKIDFLLKIIKKKYDLKGKKFFIPKDVFYALPTSEKNYVGNIPMGTKFVTKGRIASGVYWKNSGGAYDIDVSALSVDGKVGWNAAYHSQVTYSGDLTDARNGATEYISAGEKMKDPHLILANIFRGESKGSKFKVVFGKGDDISKKYMMNPNKVWFTADGETLNRQSIVGLIHREDENLCATVVNLSTGTSMVSYGGRSDQFRTALVEKWTNAFYLNDVLTKCGAKIVDKEEEADFDLTPSKLQKDSILGIFK